MPDAWGHPGALELYLDRRDKNQQLGNQAAAAQLQQATGLMQLIEATRSQDINQQRRRILADTGGDLSKAIPALISIGDDAGAKRISDISDALQQRALRNQFIGGSPSNTAQPTATQGSIQQPSDGGQGVAPTPSVGPLSSLPPHIRNAVSADIAMNGGKNIGRIMASGGVLMDQKGGPQVWDAAQGRYIEPPGYRENIVGQTRAVKDAELPYQTTTTELDVRIGNDVAKVKLTAPEMVNYNKTGQLPERIVRAFRQDAAPEDTPPTQQPTPTVGTGPTTNNVGNLRPVGATTGFQQFTTPEDGIAALDKQLLSYHKQGLNTVQKVISRYAPSTENDTSSYIAGVSRSLGIRPDQQIDLSNPVVRHMLSSAIILREKGPQAIFGGNQSPTIANKQAQPIVPGVGQTEDEKRAGEIDKAGRTELVKEDAKYVQSLTQKLYPLGGIEQRLKRMRTLTEANTTFAGIGAEVKMLLGNAAITLGMPRDSLPKIANSEQYLADMAELLKERLASKDYGSGNGISNLDLITANKPLPELVKTQGGRLQIIDALLADISRNRSDIGAVRGHFSKKGSLDGFTFPSQVERDITNSKPPKTSTNILMEADEIIRGSRR